MTKTDQMPERIFAWGAHDVSGWSDWHIFKEHQKYIRADKVAKLVEALEYYAWKLEPDNFRAKKALKQWEDEK